MPVVTLESAQQRLPDLVKQLGDGRTITITRDDQPVAQLSGIGAVGQPVPGRCRGMLTIVAEDGDHLADFADYMR